MASDNKRIAKNTVFLYVRMFLIMGVTLYTSRVILDKLGVEDYGLYNVVGGVVAMLSFLNGTLTIGTSRFITYELGSGNKDKLWKTFNTSFYTHLCLSLIVVLIMETIGLWFFYYKLVIPLDRLDACFWVYQLSLLTTLISISQVPYSALVTSHEHFNIYAYVSIFEAFAKLAICYVISIAEIDKLILYAILIAIIQISVAFYYRLYCILHFEESHLAFSFDIKIFKGLMGFSGWNIVANIAEMLKFQGIIVLINLFLTPVVVASQAIANQVTNAVMQFVNNFRMAINPQIIKLYAAGDKEGSKRLTLQSTVYCFDVILLLGLPLIYAMDDIMAIWLVEVPEYAVSYTRWIIAYNILGVIGASFYIPMMAANKIKANSLMAAIVGGLQFVTLYFILKNGGDAMWVPYTMFGATVLVFFIKPVILWKQVDYKLLELLECIWNCVKVLLAALILSYPIVRLCPTGLYPAIIKMSVTFIAVIISSLLFMDKDSRTKLIKFIRTKIHH